MVLFMKEKNLAIIGATYFQLPLILKAEEMGYTTHVFAWEAGDVGESSADFFYPISIVEKDEILSKCREIGICGICSIASDLAIITVNYVAEKMGLTGNSMICTKKSTNKHLMRRAFEKGGDPSPRSVMVYKDTDLSSLELEYPIIVKPTDRSGSRGIQKLISPKFLENAVDKAMSLSFEKKALVEEFAEGQEYSVEFISYHGKHHFLALTQKYTTGAPHFIETGHLQPAPIGQRTLERIISVVVHALDTLGIENGASHSEIKIDSKEQIKIIEIGGRMGGDCIGSHLVRYSTGYDFMAMVIQISVGMEPDFTKICKPQAVESVFISTKEDLDCFERLRMERPEDILDVIDISPALIGQTTDSSNRAGCYIKKHYDERNLS